MATELQPGSRVVFVEGVFDRATALVIRATLIDAACDVVVLDFGLARQVSDVALAILAAMLTDLQRPHVILRGLDQHQERLLRYLHIDGPPPACRVRPPPAPVIRGRVVSRDAFVRRRPRR